MAITENNKRSMENIDKIKCVLIDFEQNEKTLDEAANEILRLFSVVGRSEQLKAFADYAQKRMWEDGNKDLSEFVDEFESL